MNNNNTSETNKTVGAYRPTLAFYHPNMKGTGCAAKFELHPAHDDTDGSIWLSMANQMTIGNMNSATPTFARFDWENKIVVKLDFTDLCQILEVLRGITESINDEKGLFHRLATSMTSIGFRHIVEPVSGYWLELHRTYNGGTELRSRILFKPSEALGLCESISGAMSVISFGIPKVIPHDASAYVAKQREARNATAA